MTVATIRRWFVHEAQVTKTGGQRDERRTFVLAKKLYDEHRRGVERTRRWAVKQKEMAAAAALRKKVLYRCASYLRDAVTDAVVVSTNPKTTTTRLAQREPTQVPRSAEERFADEIYYALCAEFGQREIHSRTVRLALTRLILPELGHVLQQLSK